MRKNIWFYKWKRRDDEKGQRKLQRRVRDDWKAQLNSHLLQPCRKASQHHEAGGAEPGIPRTGTGCMFWILDASDDQISAFPPVLSWKASRQADTSKQTDYNSVWFLLGSCQSGNLRRRWATKTGQTWEAILLSTAVFIHLSRFVTWILFVFMFIYLFVTCSLTELLAQADVRELKHLFPLLALAFSVSTPSCKGEEQRSN